MLKRGIEKDYETCNNVALLEITTIERRGIRPPENLNGIDTNNTKGLS
jgi:hypothetical protein